jgi:hypothetical protein
LLAGKQFIEVDEIESINFPYSDVGNTYAHFGIIQERIKKQQKSSQVDRILAGMTEQNRHQLFNDDLKTTINLLSQTGGDPEKSLIHYMKAFEMSSFEKEIVPDIKLKHFLYFYEKAEEYCASTLIQKTDPKYGRPLPRMDLDQLERIVQFNFINRGYEDEVMHVKRMIERLCIRQLTHNISLN